VLQSSVGLLFIANTCNIGADLGAMAEASRLLSPEVPSWGFLLVFSLICMAGQLFFKYARYVSILKWLNVVSIFVFWGALGRACFLDRVFEGTRMAGIVTRSRLFG